MIAWDKICRPENREGIGLSKTEAINLTFQCKLIWKIVTEQDNLWAKHMRIKCRYKDALFRKPPRNSDFWVWKALYRCFHTFKFGIC